MGMGVGGRSRSGEKHCGETEPGTARTEAMPTENQKGRTATQDETISGPNQKPSEEKERKTQHVNVRRPLSSILSIENHTTLPGKNLAIKDRPSKTQEPKEKNRESFEKEISSAHAPRITRTRLQRMKRKAAYAESRQIIDDEEEPQIRPRERSKNRKRCNTVLPTQTVQTEEKSITRDAQENARHAALQKRRQQKQMSADRLKKEDDGAENHPKRSIKMRKRYVSAEP